MEKSQERKTSQVESKDRVELLMDAARRGADYLRQISGRRVAPGPADISALERLRGPLPEKPSPAADVLALLDEFGSPATVANAGGRYFGFVNGGAVPASLAANVLAAAWDQNAALRVMSPVGAVLEEVALGWVRQLLGLPPETAGALVTGATMANATCLVAARHALLERKAWDVEARGLFGAPEFNVVIGEEAHASLKKAMAFVGLGRERVHIVPSDGQGRMRSADFPHLKEPALVCLQAGNVNTGAFDPADELCRLAHESGSWVHVDGAFGLWAACAPARRHLMAGYENADSWATDGHKWLNVPYDCGLAFVRDGGALRNALSLEAAYLAASSSREPMHWTPESSRRARGVEVWAAIKSLGGAGVADLIERTCLHAERFATALSAAGYEILNEVVINQVMVSFGSDEATRAVITAIQQDGTCWCGGTVWHGRAAMRISVSSWATTDADVELSIAAMLRTAGEHGA
jgi:glutamate/tyrosine decarboxylase-like PLP-dependent enzyme